MRIVHYLNQFFSGVGGEDMAHVRPASIGHAVGPGLLLQKELGTEFQIVGTVYCGDSYLSESPDQAVPGILNLIRGFAPDAVVAGPAFGSGRYGLACGGVCAAVGGELGIPAVTGMHEESPGAEEFRRSVIIVRTRPTAAGMAGAMRTMASVLRKLTAGTRLGLPDEDGYIPQGLRRNQTAAERAAARARLMLERKLAGLDAATELPLPARDVVEPPRPVGGEGRVKIALVTEAAVVPRGNPDRIPSGWARRWASYDLSDLDDLTAEQFETVHGGIDTRFANEDPDRLVPLDAVRDLEREGRVEVWHELLSTCGNMGSLDEMRRIGQEIGDRLRKAQVPAAVVGST